MSNRGYCMTHNTNYGSEGCPACAEALAAPTTGPLPPHLKIEPKATSLRPKNSTERKGEPIHRGVILYFPDALAAVARLSKSGNDKHNPGQPLHWARGKSMDHMECVVRHSLTPALVDPETGETELVAVAWRALAELQLAEEKRLVAAGVLPYSGIVE